MRALLILSIPLLLAACGHPTVLIEPDSGGLTNSDVVAKGALAVSLPVTRVIVQQQKPAQNVDDGGGGHHTLAFLRRHRLAAADNTPPSANSTNTPQAANPSAGFTTNVIGADGNTYTINIVQRESDNRFIATPKNDFFSNNQFGITRLANTNIPTTVSNTFTDETAARITSIASIITKAATVAALQAGSTACTNGGDLSAVITDINGNGSWAGHNDCLVVTITQSGTHDKDAIQFSSYIPATPQERRVWPVPACINITLNIASNTGSSIANLDLKAIDPGYVYLMPIPDKGKISMHPICNADFTDSPTDRYQTYFDSMTAIENAFPTKPAH